jgi:hypothetical protein
MPVTVYELENRGQRSFIVATAEFISGDQKCGRLTNILGNDAGVKIDPGAIFKVTEACGEKLLTWKGEIRLIRKTTKKE